MVDAAVLLLLRAEDARFARDALSVFKNSFEPHIGIRHGDDPTGNGEHLSHRADRVLKAAGHTVERGKQQIPEGLPLEPPLRKAVVQQLFHHRFGVGKRLHALPHIPRRQNAHVTAQHAAAAAVIGNGDDGGKIFGVFFKTSEHRGKSRAAANGNEPRSAFPQSGVRKIDRHIVSFRE